MVLGGCRSFLLLVTTGSQMQILFFFGHLSLIRNNTQTAVTNIRYKRYISKKDAFISDVGHRCLCVISDQMQIIQNSLQFNDGF